MDRFSQGYWAQLNGRGGPEDEEVGVPKPGDPSSGIPLIEGGNPAWNDLVQYIPQEKRTEAANVLKEWDSSYNKLQEEHAPWRDFAKSGISPEYADTAFKFMSVAERDPQMVYQRLGEFLGISTEEVKEMAEESKPSDDGTTTPSLDIETHPAYQKLQQTVDTLSKIVVAQHQSELTSAEEKKQEAALEKELSMLKDKHGDFPEREIVMRMLHAGMTPDEAMADYNKLVSEIRGRSAAPMLLGSGGPIPKPGVDPQKLDSKGTKDLIVQMLNASERG